MSFAACLMLFDVNVRSLCAPPPQCPMWTSHRATRAPCPQLPQWSPSPLAPHLPRVSSRPNSPCPIWPTPPHPMSLMSSCPHVPVSPCRGPRRWRWGRSERMGKRGREEEGRGGVLHWGPLKFWRRRRPARGFGVVGRWGDGVGNRHGEGGDLGWHGVDGDMEREETWGYGRGGAGWPGILGHGGAGRGPDCDGLAPWL